MTSKDDFSTRISEFNSNKKVPVMSLLRPDIGFAAVMSKLHVPVLAPTVNSKGDREIQTQGTNNFQATSSKLARNIHDSSTVMQMLPDMELPAQILTSCIISPKDMMTTELNMTSSEEIFTPEVMSALVERCKKYLDQDYRIKPLLPKILRDILFEKGSYAIAVIPENSVDEAINGQGQIKMESLSDTFDNAGHIKAIGLLGPSKMEKKERRPGLVMESFGVRGEIPLTENKLTLEGITHDTYVEVTDNFNALKVPKLNQRVRESRVLNTIGGKALESIQSKLNDMQMTNIVYKAKNLGYRPVVKMKTQEQLNRNSVGNPLIMHLPSESVIPVHVPGNPESQVGFFVLLDVDGHPVSTVNDIDYNQQLSTQFTGGNNFASSLLTQAKNQFGGTELGLNDQVNYTTRIYTEMVEQDLLARLRNGYYNNGVAIAKKEEVYRIMLSRALAKQHTQLLFLPIELMTYMAFKHNSDGTGKSLLDEMKILNSLRVMTMLTDVHTSLRNSIGRTNIKIKLDEDDPNPQKTIEMAFHEVARTRQQFMPLGMNNPVDLVDWLGKAGMEMEFEGHPGIPDTAIEFGEKNTNYIKPDTDLSENLRKQSIMGMGLNPQTVDATYEAEFATSVVANNLLLSKRVQQLQDAFTPQLSDHIRKVFMNSQTLLNDLRMIIANNYEQLVKKVTVADGNKAEEVDSSLTPELKKDYIVTRMLSDFIANFEVTLPAPNSVTLENQMLAYKTYSEALEDCLDAWLSDGIITSESDGDIANNIGQTKEIIKAIYLRNYMAENSIMPELGKLTALDSEGNPVMDVYKTHESHIKALTQAMSKMFLDLKENKTVNDAALQAAGGIEASSVSDSTSDSGGSSSEDDGGNSDDEFSLDGMGGDEPPGGTEDTPSGNGEDDTAAKSEDTPEDKPTEEEKPEANLNGETPEAT